MSAMNKSISDQDLKRLEADTRRFLKLMKQGNYGDARLISGMLEAATYTLDAAWMKGYQARQGRLL
jgi:hypothetical protein